MAEIEKSAASVEEAVEAALGELGISEQEARIEILQEPRSGFLGLNSQPAVVKVSPRAGGPIAPALAEGSLDEEQTEQLELAVQFLEGLVEVMQVDAEVEVSQGNRGVYIDIWGSGSDEDMGLLIGKRGHTLDALQELVRTHVLRETGERFRVQVDVEDYRKRRVSQVERRAREAARRVIRSGRPETLEAMSSYERKIVHDLIAELGGLETSSEGEEPDRRVTITRRAN